VKGERKKYWGRTVLQQKKGLHTKKEKRKVGGKDNALQGEAWDVKKEQKGHRKARPLRREKGKLGGGTWPPVQPKKAQ